ncbi:capsular exopolysaccharide synthesis family protein [Gillisia mitskevichiae]|uniref:non-specific protein-tyrosine kinase n=1 Tax=Gillisia mitskevichiae TaxID=270921 RepID=A0A495PK70_9FLAO|nr:tyrosine-protein kinase family protein [Gillisia mitskevichiae]RKS50567.1 capsular exopolysaccharide synthesis family protein [Gillisia mitskevichiae]
MEELQDFTEEKESNFDLKAEIYKYLAHWKWLVLFFLIGGLLAFLYNRYTIPQFRTEASMMILNDEKSNMASALPSGGGSILTFGDNSLDNQIITLKSKRLVEKVVEELNHNISYFIEGNVITTEAYKNSPIKIKFISPDSLVQKASKTLFITPTSDTEFVLKDEVSEYEKMHNIGEIVNLDGLKFSIVPENIGSESIFKKTRTVQINIRPIDQTAGEYISRLIIAPKGKAADILSLSIIHAESEKSQDFLNNLMFQFNADGVADKRQVALSTTEFIQDRLGIITSELDSVEGGMASFKRENKFMDVSSGAQEFLAKSSRAEQEVFDIETQLMIITSVEDILKSRENYELLPSNIGIEGGISGFISTYNALVLERNAYLRNSTPQNPVVQKITASLDSLKENLRDNIDSQKRSLNIQLSELNQLDRASQSKFSGFPGMEKGMRGIERQQQIKEQLYLFLLQRREEAAIAFAVTGPVAKVIDPAYTIPSAVDPKPWLILVGGFLIGLLLPLLVLFGKFMLDTKVHHKGDLETLIKNIPFLGEIPRISEGLEETIQLNDRSPLAESFRILRTNLAYLLKPKSNNKGEIIYVTSTIKGEGKTFITYNLARTLASTKKKVVIIGADIRNPKLHRYLDLPMDSKGLSDYLYNYDLTSFDIINKSLNEDLKVDFVLSGSIPPNPAELFMSDRMKNLLDELSSNYDFVIVDTAPTMIVTDTLLISPLADTTLYVTRAGYTEKKLLEFPKELKQQGKLKGLAIILNDVDYSKFSYGAKYGYSYGYGYGYGVDEESKWSRVKKKVLKK